MKSDNEGYTIDYRIVGARLFFKLILPEINQYEKSRYYLVRLDNWKIVEQSACAEIEEQIFDLHQSGPFLIKAMIQEKDAAEQVIVLSEPFDYHTEEDVAEFEEFCQTERSCDMLYDPSIVYRRKKPYGSFLLSYNDGRMTEKDSFLKNYAMSCRKIDDRGILWTDEDIEGDSFLSGIAFADGKLLWGNTCPDSLDDCVGVFTYCRWGGEIECGTDYFGIGKLYYWVCEEGKSIVCSNNFHMLILFLVYAGEVLDVDEDIILAILAKQYQVLENRFSRKLEVKGVRLLEIDKKILIHHGCVEIVNKPIHESILSPMVGEAEQYGAHIAEAATEIKENLRVAIADDHFSRIIVQLTGGLDSRVNFAALTNIGASKEIYIYSHLGDKYACDYSLANTIGGIFGYPKCGIKHSGYKHYTRSEERIVNEAISFYLFDGNYFPFNIYTNTTDPTWESVLTLGGLFGEVCIRSAYFTRPLLAECKDVSNLQLRQIMDELLSPIYCLSAKSYNCFYEEMYNEVAQLPGKCDAEKYELHYLFYGNRHHFGRWAGWDDGFSWAGLQTKTGFRLCRNAYMSDKDGIHVAFDLLAHLNPVLTAVPFDSEKNNIAMKAYKQSEFSKGIFSRLTFERVEFPDEKPSLLMVQRDAYDESMAVDTEEEWKEKALTLLHQLIAWDHGRLKSLFGIDVYIAITKSDRTTLFIKELYVKLLLIYELTALLKK